MTNKEKTINSLANLIQLYVEDKADDVQLCSMLRNLVDGLEEVPLTATTEPQNQA